MGTSSLVSYWRLDESGGTTAADSKGTNTGTYTGGVTLGTNGAVAGDTAASFDGTSDYVAVPDAASLDITGDLTLEAWAKPSVVDANSHAVVSKAYSNATENRQYRLGISTTTGSPRWRGTVYIAGTSYGVDSTAAPVAGAWQHLVLVRQGGTLTLYVNGVAQGSTPVPATGTIQVTTGQFDIGRLNSPSNPEYFAGGIDEVAIYKAALSAAQVQAHYNAR